MPKRYTKRRNGRKPLTRPQYKQVAKIANKQIHKMAELKTLDEHFDTSASLGPNDGFIGVRKLLLMPSQNTTTAPDGGRDGDSIYLRSLSINGWLDCSTTQQLVMRLILVQWLDSDVVPPTLKDILQSHDGTGGGNNGFKPVNSHYLSQPKKRFRILDDRTYAWDSNVASAPKPYRIRLSTKDFAIKKPQFTKALLTGQGNIYLFHFADQAVGGAGMNEAHYRIRYYDN